MAMSVSREFMSVFLRATIVPSSRARLDGDSCCLKLSLVLLNMHGLLGNLLNGFFGRYLSLGGLVEYNI